MQGGFHYLSHFTTSGFHACPARGTAAVCRARPPREAAERQHREGTYPCSRRVSQAGPFLTVDPAFAPRITATETPGGASDSAFGPGAGLPVARSRLAWEPPSFPSRHAVRGPPFHPLPLAIKAASLPPGTHCVPGTCLLHRTEFSQNSKREVLRSSLY